MEDSIMPRPLHCPSALLEQDLSGKVYVVTGANSGIGLATVEQLARQGATVVLACRRVKEGEAARARIQARGTIEVMELDLADLASVRRFAAAFLERHRRLDGLVNNAGVMNVPQGRTQDGFETQIGVNHLGHFLLTELLLEVLKASAPARIVVVSSSYHAAAMGRTGHIVLDDLHFERRKYDGWEAYAQSKLANVLHARSLASRLTGTGVVAVSVHPGWVRTNLISPTMPRWLQDYVLRPVLRLGGMIEPWDGAQTSLYALLCPEVAEQAGAYFSQTGIYKERALRKGGWPMRSPNPEAHDDALAEKLYAESRRLVGLEAAARG
jgi:retinol dehydrogenase-13